MKVLHWLLREGKAILLLTLSFFVCYGTVLLSKKLVLAHYDINRHLGPGELYRLFFTSKGTKIQD